jgi:hypothetical protein
LETGRKGGRCMKLGELRPGDVFRSPSRALWVVLDGTGGGGKRRYQLLGPRGGLVVTTPGDTPVEPLDLPALLEEHALFRRLLEDAGQDQGYTIGMWAERGEVVRMLEEEAATVEHWNRGGDETDTAAAEAVYRAARLVRARGLAATAPHPPPHLTERMRELEKENERLRQACDVFERNSEGVVRLEAALRELVGATLNDTTARGQPYEWSPNSALAAARAVLDTK